MRIGEMFDRYFIHIFVTIFHLFFIITSVWLERFDLMLLGIVMLVISFVAFETVNRCSSEERNENV